MKFKFPLLVWPLLGLLLAPVVRSEPVSTQPPPEYVKFLQPLLTPLESVLQNSQEPPKHAEDGWVLLEESLHHVLPDGRRLMVSHQVSRALTDGGAETLGRDVTGYRLSTQTLHLVLAHTIQPDGRRQPVKPEACFLQTPQREADEALYHDQGELVVIFPNVKAGSTVEYIIVFEEKKPRIPGHYTSMQGFQFGWPIRQHRAILTLPPDYADRLRITPLGTGVPEAVREVLPEGAGTRWTWQARNIRGVQGEPGMAPFIHTGPLVRLTTLQNWGQFLDWYVPLAERQTGLGPKLEAEVASLTENAKSPREILDILHAKVANDVRYVGLEFGDSDLEPHPVAEVWEHQYGDCKDKASLLRAMLLHKGISAHMVLINTRHLGRVERRSPDFRDFNHAILVADLPEGPVFCDPTITGSVAGMLSPSDADREVLIVTRPERWMRTPPQDAGRYALNFDAKLSASGELTGWATLEADGYMGLMYQDWEARSTRQQIKERLTNRIEATYPGARVVDVKTVPRTPGRPYQIQAYFAAPPSGSMNLRFPLDMDFLPSLGDGEDRRTDAFLWRETTTTESVFELPAGFRLASLPPPQTVKNPHLEGSTAWKINGRKLTASVSFQVKSSRIPAAEVLAFAQSLDTLRAWLDKPVTLEAGEGSEPVASTTADGLGDFPRMPTGEGQLNLVSQRFPLNGNLKLRRAALEKTLTYFPKDVRTQFSAHVYLAYLDTVEEAFDAAIQRLRVPLDTQRGSVPLEDASLGEYVLALALQGKKQDAEALAILERIIADEQVSPFRRAWSQSIRAEILMEKDPELALKAAQAGVALEEGDTPGLLLLVAELRGHLKQPEGLLSDLEAYLAKETPQTQETMLRLAGALEDWSAEKPATAAVVHGVLAALDKKHSFGDKFAAALATARNRIDAQNVYGSIQTRLRDWVKANPGALPAWKAPESLKTPEDFTKAIDQALGRENKNAAELIGLAVESLVRFEPGGWWGERLWRAVSFVDFQDKNENPKEPPPLLLQLMDLCEAAPASSEPNLESRFIRAMVLTRRDGHEEAGRILAGLVNQPGLDDGYLMSAISRYADNCVVRKDAAAAIAAWRKLSKFLHFHSTPTELLKGCFVALQAGQQHDAMVFVHLLRKVDPAVVAKTPAAEHVQSFLKFGRDDQILRDWWARSARWWPVWEELEKKHLPIRAADTLFVPVIPNLHDHGASLGELAQAGEREKCLENFRLIGYAARWQPSMAAELASLMPSASRVNLAAALPDLRRLVIAINKEGGIEDPDDAGRITLWAAVSLLDGGQPDEGRALARAWFEKHGAGTLLGEGMLRLWGLGALQTGKDIHESAAALEKLLRRPSAHDQRWRSVASLASLYQKQGRQQDELALIKKELSHADTLRAGEALEPLRQRLQVLEEGAGAGDGPKLAAEAWLKASKPGWFDHVRPRDLQDEKAAEPDEAMQPGTGRLMLPEAVKLCVLTAQDAAQPDERRYNAIAFLGWYSASIARDLPEATRWIDALKAEKSLPRPVRARLLWLFVRNSFWSDRLPAFRHYQTDPLLDLLDGTFKDDLEAVRPYAKVDPADLDGTARLAENVLQAPIGDLSIQILQRCIRRLAEAGRMDKARALYQAMGKARYVDRLAREKASLQLATLKIINGIQKLQPVHDALRDWFLKSPLATAPAGTPPVPEPYDRDRPLDLPEPEALQLYRQWIHAGTWPRDGVNFWVDLVEAIPMGPEQPGLALQVLSIALEKAPDDPLRADLVRYSLGMVDLDDPPTREKLETVLKPWRTRADFPLTQDSLRLYDLNTRLRVGQPVDLFASFGTLKEEIHQRAARWNILRALLSQGDKSGLRRLLDNMSTDELLSRACVLEAHQAYRLLGMNDEAELAADQMRQIVEDEVVASWMFANADDASRPVHLALSLQQPALIPEAFSTQVTATTRHPREKLFFQCLDARLRSRWEACAQHAAEGMRLYPTFYDFYSHRGIACAELGRKEDAISALETFTRYDHNSTAAKEALDRLKVLKATTQP